MSVLDESAPSGALAPPLRKNRNFLLLWTGAGFTLFGMRITMIAYPLLVLWNGGSVIAAGLVSAAVLLPQLLVQLPAGALVDRLDRRKLMISCDVGCVLLTASVAVAVFLGRIWLPHLLIAAFIQASLGIFYVLSERSAVRHLVPEEQLPAALTQNEARERAAGLLGEPAGSAFFALATWLPFLSTALAHLASFFTLIFIKKKFQSERPKHRRTLRTEMSEGIAWVWRQKFLRTVMTFIAVSNIPFEGLALSLIVIILDRGSSPVVIGVIIAISGIGGVLGAVSGTWWMRRLNLRVIVIGGLVAWTLLMPLVAFTDNPTLLGAIFAASSYVGGVFNVVGGVYMVRITPDEMMGRVGSVATLLGSGTNFLGALAAGFLIQALGTANTILGLSALMVVLVVMAVASPSVRNVVNTPAGAKLTDTP